MSSEEVPPKNLPYAAEYAKSGRAACKGCRDPIALGSLRMSVRLPSRFFDGLQDNWFHFGCFWKRVGKGSINEASIRGIALLKWDDQEKIRAKIEDSKSGAEGSAGEISAPKVKVEYAKTNRGKCSSCKEAIDKGVIRLGLKSSWYHTECFKKDHQAAVTVVKDISGFDDLDESDQKTLTDTFGDKTKHEKKRKQKEEISEENPKKPKVDDKAAAKYKKKLKAQSEKMWELRSSLEKCGLKKKEMQQLLEANHQQLPKHGGESKLLEKLVECMVFGCPGKCPRCGGHVTFSSSQQTYVCTGHLTAFTHCTYTDRNPPRALFFFPEDMLDEVEGLKNIKIKPMIDHVYADFSNEEIVQPPKSFSYLGAQPSEVITHASGMKSGHSGMKGKQRQIMKDGAIVDPDCEYQDVVHVWKDSKGEFWQVTLGCTDIMANKNSYYKLQLLRHDSQEKYYLFRSWGRVGTNIGGSKTESFGKNLDEAKALFEQLFLEKTGNEWSKRKKFVKKMGGMCILETDTNGNDGSLTEFGVKAGSLTKLPKSIQEIVSMVFDVNSMTKTLQELEIDLDKMPLGKLSKGQMQRAYSVLSELQELISAGEVTYEQYLDATNKFYTYIPHHFAVGTTPPLLNSNKRISEKTKMLDELMEIEIAYSILKSDSNSDKARDPIDVHYEKLKAKMEVLDKDSEEYIRICKYVRNTHAPTHDAYKLEIIDIIRVYREGESGRFKKEIGNRHLLWHGSRITNYAGILSQGLRIAPPEAPVTGYMFGKGIYFADMVSKSANYCYTMSGEGFVLLCDVALGEMQEEIQAKAITKLKKGKNSCKGVGRTVPDPKEKFVTEEGVTIPLGKPVDTGREDLTLLYNEYIVYDVAQVEIKYLLRLKFISNLF